MAINVTRHRLFSGCRSGVMALSDLSGWLVVATIPIGSGVDGARFDATSGDAFASKHVHRFCEVRRAPAKGRPPVLPGTFQLMVIERGAP
jgi:hypothetical protein